MLTKPLDVQFDVKVNDHTLRKYKNIYERTRLYGTAGAIHNHLTSLEQQTP
jgi:hypothetical protein